MKKILKRIAAMSAAVMMMASISSMGVSAADNTFNLYISNTGSNTSKTMTAGYTSKAGSASVTYQIDSFNATSVSYNTLVGGYSPTNRTGSLYSTGSYVRTHSNSNIKAGYRILTTMTLNPNSSGIGSYSSGMVYGS